MLPYLHTRGLPGCLHARALGLVRSPVAQPARCIAQMHGKLHVSSGSKPSSLLHERFAGCRLAGRTLHQVCTALAWLQGHKGSWSLASVLHCKHSLLYSTPSIDALTAEAGQDLLPQAFSNV